MITVFLSGAICLASLVVAVFFLKFWRTSKEGLFLLFSLAFAMLGFERIVLMFSPKAEVAPYGFIIRLVAFSLIIAGIIAKNRRR